MEERSVPFLQLVVESWDPNSLVLGIIPFAFLLVLLIAVGLIYLKRRSQETKEWRDAAASPEKLAADQGLAQKESEEDEKWITPPEKPAAPQPTRETLVTPRELPVPPSSPGSLSKLEVSRDLAETPKEPSVLDEIRSLDQGGWLKRLHLGLGKTRSALASALGGIFSGGQLDENLLEKVHSALYRADLGVATTDHLTEFLRKNDKLKLSPSWDVAREELRGEMVRILQQVEKPLEIKSPGPWIVLVVGVNGAGKTTTIGKLAGYFMSQGKKVILCAGDTFRAAAIDQLQVWGDRTGAAVIKQQQGSDPAAVAYDGVKAAVARNADVLIIDTAGRLQNKEGLMAELGKIRKVIGRDVLDAPHETWLVLDATTGQNALSQVKAFSEVTPLTGLVVTKLDGTAKGGFVVGIANQFKVPIHFVGVGEKASDLRSFAASDYAASVI